jgi:methylmalonyl-CoA mutase cobalamin-binding subunit
VYHTLGALVLGGQLRRKRLSVKLILGGRPNDIAERVSSTDYDCVFLSSSRGESLESLRRLVEAVKSATKTPPPVVVGGTILEVEQAETITTLTGADFATIIPDEALAFCGLNHITQNHVHSRNRA